MKTIAILSLLGACSPKPAPTPTTPTTPITAPGEVTAGPEVDAPPFEGHVRIAGPGFSIDVPPDCKIAVPAPKPLEDYMTAGSMCQHGDALGIGLFTHVWSSDRTDAQMIAAGEKSMSIFLLLAADAKFEARRPITAGAFHGEEITWHLGDRPAVGRLIWNARSMVIVGVMPTVATPGPDVRAIVDSIRLVP